ncbi:MAG: ABC transporter permease [Candidatus Aenigmarchaeota archaeon]|nr:ABC transporter permease [Candidatus Aenigmarchaeota archaeon]
MRTIFFLALKDIARDRRIVLLVISLLAFSYINLTFFPAFLNGLSDTFQSEIINTGTSHIIIQPSVESGKTYLNFESSTRKKIDLIPGVVKSSGTVSLAGTVSFQGREMGSRIEAITPSDDMEVTTIHQKVVKGEYLEDSDTDDIVIGNIIAGKKIEDTIGKETSFGRVVEGLGGVEIGQKVKIRFPNGVEKEYKVKGIVSSEGFGFVSQTIYMNKKEVQKILGLEGKASSIRVRLDDRNRADYYKNLILELGIADADIRTWEEASAFTEGINQTFGVVILVTTIVGVIIVMSTIGIVVFINTSRKKRIIGVLKAIGMQKNQIMQVFLFESLIFGIAGAVIGLVIVYSFIFYLNANPLHLAIGNLRPLLLPETAVSSLLVLIVSSVVAGYIPARMASRQDILENIRVVE